MAEQPTLAERARATRYTSRILVASGLIVGIGMPIVFWIMKIQVMPAASGFDLIWLLFFAVMLVDFGMAYWFARRASDIERSMPPA